MTMVPWVMSLSCSMTQGAMGLWCKAGLHFLFSEKLINQLQGIFFFPSHLHCNQMDVECGNMRYLKLTGHQICHTQKPLNSYIMCNYFFYFNYHNFLLPTICSLPFHFLRRDFHDGMITK